MGLKIKFDSTHNVISPTLILAYRNGDKIGNLPATDIVVKDCFNSPAELSFTVHKEDCTTNELKDESIKITPVYFSEAIGTVSGYFKLGTIKKDGYDALVQYNRTFD